jgi:hypothetical protein
MADYSSIGPLNATAQKESLPLVGYILLDAVVVLVVLGIVGTIVNAL